jgi:nitroreductase
MTVSPVIEAIKNRRSIREYTDEQVAAQDIEQIILSGIWAPSGLNNQPWRFVIITEESIKDSLSEQTTYGHIIKAAPLLIAVFLDTNSMYDQVKDHQSAGACIQNMLLTAESQNLGAVWLGQILKNKNKVNKILEIEEQFDLMAVLAIGHPANKNQRSSRNILSEFILKRI